ncbi:UV-endonuclease UvdE [Stereum hirsutum FP-91666 SS1]|uniref:UV-endonuclease UvdE n=1 Tax=Stereum hirsutum (strain FP-91666) TaxID=721885 RepID=UPI000440F8C6|nr:UV-endonuclease UvdE [Stereum hirsutum FP-91666 SS1]EIM87219.1 UV-endonuclease UvdE [Stereum hirsutum FP-91666 SS1]
MAKRSRKVTTDATVAPTSTDLEGIGSIPAQIYERRVSTRLSAKNSAPVREDGEEDSPLTEIEEDAPEPPKKKRRRTKVVEPVVYNIPDIEKLNTTWKGRLGYACLNTILRVSKPDSIFCSRTCRIDTINKNGLDFAKNLGIQNTKDLCKMIQWNEDNNIRFMRISSEMFPFASHGIYGYDLDYAAEELKAAGDLANKLGHRMTLHPGQFTQLGSPKENVVTASIRELKYHTSMLDYMGMGPDSVIIIHMGGMYGDKPAALARFKENYTTLVPDKVKARLVLENDEICYNADDLLPVCEELKIPIVFDYHHNWIFPSELPLSTLIPRINATWHRKGIRPKQHLSSPRPGAVTVMERRAHAGRCPSLPSELELEGAGWKKEYVDLMIEAKDKEQAVFQLHRSYDLRPVIWENLRPVKEDPGFSHDVKEDDDLDEGDGDGGVGVEGGSGTRSSPRKRKASKKGESCYFLQI